MDSMLSKSQTTLMLIVVFFATFMDGLDSSIISVALPDIGSYMGVDTATISWASIIYMMVLAGTLVPFAKISADTGVKKVMMAGLITFSVGSLICGISTSFWMLIAARAIQGFGAAMMGATGPMCCTKHLPHQKLAFGLTIVAVGASLGFAIGPAICGFIIEYFSWNWVFLINIPIGLIAVPIMYVAIPSSSEEGGKCHLDIAGTILLFAAITCVVFAIETLSYSSMRLYSIISAMLGFVLLVTFAMTEKRKKDPLLHVKMFRNWQFTLMFVCLMCINMIYMGMQYLLPFYGETCLGMSSLTVGLYMLMAAVIPALTGIPIAKWSDRKGRRPFCMCVGIFSIIAFGSMGVLAKDMTRLLFAFTMIPMGLAWSFVGGPMGSNLVEHATEDRNMASALTNEGLYIGGSIGMALMAMSFTLFSGTDGIDIDAVSAAQFVEGFVPSAFIAVALGAFIRIASYLVKDNMNGN